MIVNMALKNVAGRLIVANFFIKSKEGTGVSFLLVWCGRSAMPLVAAGYKSQR
tara:strand:+ start:68799 stop:68957 length:159 start_codon:yes stop_codon:yes gene_type:complete